MYFANEFDFERTYYLSGPMAGYPEHNFPAFEKATHDLRDAGVKVLPAHEIKHASPEVVELQWEDYLRTDLIQMLGFTNGIILLKGWPKSRGARLELDVALALSYPVWFYDMGSITNMNGATNA